MCDLQLLAIAVNRTYTALLCHTARVVLCQMNKGARARTTLFYAHRTHAQHRSVRHANISHAVYSVPHIGANASTSICKLLLAVRFHVIYFDSVHKRHLSLRHRNECSRFFTGARPHRSSGRTEPFDSMDIRASIRCCFTTLICTS